VAEEVARIAPNLVIFDKDGQPQTVRYHFMNAMLLNEVQKQRRLIEAQEQQIEQLKAALESQQSVERTEMISLREEVKAMHDLLQKSGVPSLAQLAGNTH